MANGMSSTGGTSLCTLELIRRAVNSGNLVATVGVNVLTSEMEPVAGANVYVDGVFKGITGSGTFGTSGYLKLYSIAGEKTFSAESNDSTLTGSITETLKVLGVHNVDITVGETTPMPPDSNVTGGAFRTVTYTGNDVSQDVFVGFEPTMVWVKNVRNETRPTIVDRARGVMRELWTSHYGQEIVSPLGVTSFNEDGFSVGSGANVNQYPRIIAAWCWSAPNEKNATGDWPGLFDIQPDKEFYGGGLSILTYTGTGMAGNTLPHSLGTSPEMMIFKTRDTGEWGVYHKDLGNNYMLKLNRSYAASQDSGFLNETSPDALKVTLGDSLVSNPTQEMVAYLFASKEGMSKVGSYIGDATDVILDLGFRPDFFMVKRSDGAAPWWIIDSERGIVTGNDPAVRIDQDSSEALDVDVADPIPGGLSIQATNGDWNTAGGHYIYLAFKESNVSQ